MNDHILITQLQQITDELSCVEINKDQNKTKPKKRKKEKEKPPKWEQGKATYSVFAVVHGSQIPSLCFSETQRQA